jgi:hypothetical protein
LYANYLNIAHKKDIIRNQIRYIGKESNSLEHPDYLEITDDYEIINSAEFKNWILSLKPKDVKDKGNRNKLCITKNG